MLSFLENAKVIINFTTKKLKNDVLMNVINDTSRR